MKTSSPISCAASGLDRARKYLDKIPGAISGQGGHAQTFIVGVDDPWYGKPSVRPILARLPEQGAAILLAHEPDFADEFSQFGRFDLQLSGHSHGGQVCLPTGAPIRLPAYGQKYPRGRYQVGDMILYTNRGVGSSGIPVRFNCRPEISLFTLRAKEAN